MQTIKDENGDGGPLVFSGEKLVHETIRQIMAARAIHNVFKMTESRMVVSSESMRYEFQSHS